MLVHPSFHSIMYTRALFGCLLLVAAAKGRVCDNNQWNDAQIGDPMVLGYTLFVETGNYYKLHMNGTTWTSAKEICEYEGAHLVVVDSNEESEALKSFLQHRKPPSWPYAGFYAVHSTYLTIFGDPVSSTGYNKWFPGRPWSDISGCVDLNGKYRSCMNWPGAKAPFVCEREASTQRPTPSRPSALAAASRIPFTFRRTVAWPSAGYERLHESGYYKVHARNATWWDARAACEAENAHLAVLESEAEAAALSAHLQAEYSHVANFFVGAFAVENLYVTVFGDFLTESVTWWASDNPRSRTCVSIGRDAQLADPGCNKQYGFVCEQKLTLSSCNTN